jgi:hypothetical protein
MDTRPSTDYHPQCNKDINQSVDPATIDLSEETLLAEARQATGLQRFGDESFLPAFRRLLSAMETEAQLNAFGRMHAKGNTLGSLMNRLWANACFEAHPEILERKIVAPIIIIGPHRSGTTRMHRMMATDTRLQHLQTWEGFNPAPRLGQPDLGRAARYGEVNGFLTAAQPMYPGAFTGHPMHADWAEEEMLLLNHSFCSFSVLGNYAIPEYYKWFIDYDKTSAYRYMADLMKLISWSRGDAEDKRWVLKNPQHMLDLDILLKVFPDAKLVFTHRDPLKTVASIMSLMWHFARQHTDRPIRAPMRDVWLDFCEQAARRCMQARETIPTSQQIDVHYEDVNRDWRDVMRRVYDFGGIALSTEAEQAMAGWLEQSESESRHVGHRYALEDFGITDDEVDARMMSTRRHYSIPYEGK